MLCYTLLVMDSGNLVAIKSPKKMMSKFFIAGVSARYRKVPKSLDRRKLCCNLPKIQTKTPNLWVYRQKYAYGIGNSEDPDQTAPLGAV